MGENGIKYSLVARPFRVNEDYDIIKSWWNAHGDHPLPPEYLSSTGIIIEAESKPVCCGFLYKTDSKICMFQFVVTDFSAVKDIRDSALSLLIKLAKKWAESNGFGLIYGSGSSPKYISRLEEEDFIKVGTPQYHLFHKV